jgi:3-deoxy-7-phosphoheptulonate synthase
MNDILVEKMSLAALAAGADGLLVEVHVNPCEAKSDADQQLNPGQFKALMEKIRKLEQFMADPLFKTSIIGGEQQ